MKKAKYNIIALLLLTMSISCKKAYVAQLTSTATGYLAVDGPIISGDSTFIKVSRTTSLSDTTQSKAELKAVVSVEDDQNKLYMLSEQGKGVYTLGVTNFSTIRKYRLDIKTSNGKIYQSDFVQMKVTPPIDSLYFKQTGPQTINFYVNTHDATNNTRYYRWDYKETWSYVSCYSPTFQYKNGVIFPIVPGSTADISTCYQNAMSNEIFIGSSANITQDIITAQQLGSLVGGTVKIAHVYVMQLRQYALTEAGFKYYQNLKTNTENLGSIFDAQPSTTTGNIHCITSPTDLVLGFISASTVTAKQYNLHNTDLKFQLQSVYPTGAVSTGYFAPPDIEACTVTIAQPPQPPTARISPGTPWLFLAAPAANYSLRLARTLATGDSLVITADATPDANGVIDVINSFTYAPKICVDCRLRGFTNIRPSYFPVN
jgi:hypothetical protein